MKDFWKGVIAVLTLQWLFGGSGNNNSGCGCGGCLGYLILLFCFIFWLLGLM